MNNIFSRSLLKWLGTKETIPTFHAQYFDVDILPGNKIKLTCNTKCIFDKNDAYLLEINIDPILIQPGKMDVNIEPDIKW